MQVRPEDVPWMTEWLDKIDLDNLTQFWHHPPNVSPGALPFAFPGDPLLIHFTHSLFLWAPGRVFGIDFLCENMTNTDADGNPAPCNTVMWRNGFSKTLKDVYDMHWIYKFAQERYTCPECEKRKQLDPDFSFQIEREALDMHSQLKLHQQLQCPVINGLMMCLDKKVYTLLKETSSTAASVRRLLVKFHQAEYDKRLAQFFHHVKRTNPSTTTYPTRPSIHHIPAEAWFHEKFVANFILNMPTEVLPTLTSYHGRVLKIDATRKAARYIGGSNRGVASWIWNVGNEDGQIIFSAVVPGERLEDLQMAADGIMLRYHAHGVAPPKVIFVDKGCCVRVSDCATQYHDIFNPDRIKEQLTEEEYLAWKNAEIRLDMFHALGRIDEGVTSTSHILFKPFMQDLTRSVFDLDQGDLNDLLEAEASVSHTDISDEVKRAEILSDISSKKLKKFVRRKTVSPDRMEKQVEEVLNKYAEAKDDLLNPLFNEKMMAPLSEGGVWAKLKRHTVCLQDPPEEVIPMYQAVREVKVGEKILTEKRSMRGTSSVENYHMVHNKAFTGKNYNPASFMAISLQLQLQYNENAARRHMKQMPQIGHNPTKHVDGVSVAESRFTHDLLEKQNKNMYPDAEPMDPGWVQVPEYTGELMSLQYLNAVCDPRYVIDLDPASKCTFAVQVDEGYSEETDLEQLGDTQKPTEDMVGDSHENAQSDAESDDGLVVDVEDPILDRKIPAVPLCPHPNEQITEIARMLVDASTNTCLAIDPVEASRIADLVNSSSDETKKLLYQEKQKEEYERMKKLGREQPLYSRFRMSRSGTRSNRQEMRVRAATGKQVLRPPTYNPLMKAIVNLLLSQNLSPTKNPGSDISMSTLRSYSQLITSVYDTPELKNLLLLFPSSRPQISDYYYQQQKSMELERAKGRLGGKTITHGTVQFQLPPECGPTYRPVPACKLFEVDEGDPVPRKKRMTSQELNQLTPGNVGSVSLPAASSACSPAIASSSAVQSRYIQPKPMQTVPHLVQTVPYVLPVQYMQMPFMPHHSVASSMPKPPTQPPLMPKPTAQTSNPAPEVPDPPKTHSYRSNIRKRAILKDADGDESAMAKAALIGNKAKCGTCGANRYAADHGVAGNFRFCPL